MFLAFCASQAAAADFSFSGSFTRDDDQRSFYLTLDHPQTVVLRTSSYAGGVSASGSPIPGGGFDPTLSLFDADGNLIASNTDGACGNVMPDPVTSYCFDAFISVQLPAGRYQVVLTQSENTPNGPTLADSFAYDGQSNFTAGPQSSGAQGFQDAFGTPRSGAFAMDVVGADTSQAQVIVSQQSPPAGKVGTAYSYQFTATGGTLPYSWTAPANSLPPGLTLASNGLLSGTPTAIGTSSFTVQAADSSNPPMSATQPVQIQINPPDLLITTASPLPAWVVNNSFSQTLTATGGVPPYSWAFTGSGASAPASIAGLTLTTAGVLSGTPPALGSFTLPVQVTDSRQNTVQRQFAWLVNPPITITNTPTLPPGVTARAYNAFAFTAQGGASATDVWTVVNGGGALPSGMSLSQAGILQGTPSSNGVFSFRVQATDGVQPVQQTVTLSVYDPLTITTGALPGGVSGQPYGPVTLTATGGSGSYTWNGGGLPGGLSISSTGQISGTPGTAGAFSAQVVVIDTTAGQNTSRTLPVAIAFPSLLISGGGDLGGVGVNASVSKTFTATGGKPPYTWSASGLPAGLSLDAVSGSLTGTATQPGNFSFSVQVTDGQPSSLVATATFAVVGITTSSTLPAATTTTAYSQTFNAAGGTPPYSFSASGIPAGLSLASSGVLGGTARTAGTYSLRVQATDSTGISASALFSLAVTAPSLLTVAGGSLAKGTINTPYSDTLSANGGAAPYQWDLIGGALPDGLSASGAGTISGTPTRPGAFTFTARATDTSGGSASASFTITVDPAPLTLTNGSLPNGIVGSDYPVQVLTPNGGLGPYTFAVTSGGLPAGLSFSAGQISGTPTTAGSSSFTVTVTDSANKSSALTLQITARPAQADLILSSSSTGFTVTSGAAGLPTPASVPVRSSVILQVLNYTVNVTPAAPWLDVAGGGTTPGSIAIALNSAALALAASATPYQTVVMVNCVAPSPCAGSVQQISVSLSVSAAPPQLSVTSDLLSFSASTVTPQTASQTFGLQNKGGGSLIIRSVSAADGWVTVSGAPASLASGPATAVTVNVNPSGLTPGYYRSAISVASSAGSATLPVTLLLAKNDSMSLSPAGAQFTMQAGGAPGNPNGNFLVSLAGSSTVNWDAAVLPGAPWLTLQTASGTASSSNPGSVNYSINLPVAATLTSQAYYATIRVTSSGVVDSPQDFVAILNVTAITDPVKPDPQPAGLVFISTGTGSIPPQSLQLFASSTTPVAYQASASTTDGKTWLSVSPTTGTSSASTPGHPTVSVDPTGLPPGVYRGGAAYAFVGQAVRTVNVTLIIQATGAPVAQARLISAAAGSSCSPVKLVPTQTGLVNNFGQPTAWPTALSIRVVDDCGTSIGNGQVVATFSNGDPPLALLSADKSSGVYSGTWTPRGASSQVTISARATATGFPAATAQITGQVTPNAAPVLTPNATLHVFDPLVGGSLGPGSIVQIYGANLSAQPSAAPVIPLPVTLGGTSVIIGGIPAPLYFVSPGQVNAQIPFELNAGQKYQIIVSANGSLTTPDSLQLTDVSPGIAAFASGQIIAQHLDATLSLITEASPAKPGEVIVFYLAGLGLTDNPVVTGAASPGDVLARPQDAPVLTLNGANVPVLFAGLTPGLVGLYQVNFQVPDNAPNGDLQLIVTQGGSKSNSVILPVKK